MLRQHETSVWFDQSDIKLGDCIPSRVFSGIDSCDIGVLVISPSFLKKSWTLVELEVLQKKAIEKDFLVIPILVNISLIELSDFSEFLGNRLCLDNKNLETTALKIALEASKRQVENVYIRGRPQRIKWHCPVCGEVLFGEVEICPSCQSDITINERVSLFTLVKDRLGWFGALTYIAGLLSIYVVLFDVLGGAIAMAVFLCLLVANSLIVKRKRF